MKTIIGFFQEIDRQISEYLANHDISPVFVKIMTIQLFSFSLAKVHEVLGTVSLLLSISYLLWRWRRDYLIDKKKQELEKPN